MEDDTKRVYMHFCQKAQGNLGIHSAKDAIKAYELCVKEGFDTSLDIIYDTALDTKELLGSELACLKALRPVHLSAYSLTIEEQTKFFAKPHKKQNNEDLSAYFFCALDELFGAYEISNFGKIAFHNSGYWAYEDYICIFAIQIEVNLRLKSK